MNETPFTRLISGSGKVLHVAKDRFPNESLCGRVLDPTPVTSRGRRKCELCQKTLANLREAVK